MSSPALEAKQNDGAHGRTRTGTTRKDREILSLLRLPISPRGHEGFSVAGIGKRLVYKRDKALWEGLLRILHKKLQ